MTQQNQSPKNPELFIAHAGTHPCRDLIASDSPILKPTMFDHAASESTDPCLSVITIVHNGEQVIASCIESVLAQQIEGLQYIIIDGASTDRTMEIICSYGSAISICVSEPDKSLYDAMNKGLRLARGRFIHFLNSDDLYFDDGVLARIIPELDEGEVVFGQMEYVEADGSRRLLGRSFSWESELRASRVPQMALIVPKSCYEKVGEFDTSLRIAADYDMTLRLAKYYPIRYVNIPVSIMYAGGVSYRSPHLAFRESMTVSRRHGRSTMAACIDYSLKMFKWWGSRLLPRSVLELIRSHAVS